MDTSNGAVPHHSVSTHSHHHRLGLLHISYSLLVFLSEWRKAIYSKRSTFLHSKGNELFVTTKSQRKNPAYALDVSAFQPSDVRSSIY